MNYANMCASYTSNAEEYREGIKYKDFRWKIHSEACNNDCKLTAFNAWNLVCKKHSRLHDRPGHPRYIRREEWLKEMEKRDK